jgi:hypothetical protein
VEVAGGASKKTASTVIRKSSRYKGSAANKPAMERAKERAAERNLEKGNDFTVLDTYSDDHLTSVAADCCVVFTPSAGTPVEALSLIRAKERVQAALASVTRRQEIAKEEEAAREAREAAFADQGVTPTHFLGSVRRQGMRTFPRGRRRLKRGRGARSWPLAARRSALPERNGQP